MRGKDIQEKDDMEETRNFSKCSINEVLTSAPRVVTQEEPQTSNIIPGRRYEHII